MGSLIEQDDLIVKRMFKNLLKTTKTVDKAEELAFLLWWTFISQHAEKLGIDPGKLAQKTLSIIVLTMPIFQKIQENFYKEHGNELTIEETKELENLLGKVKPKTS